MKKFVFALLVGTICASILVAQADKSKPIVIMQEPPAPAVEYNPNAWKEFSSREGRFSIRFPGTPVVVASTMQTSQGAVSTHKFLLKLPESYYHISYLDYPTYADTDEFVSKTLQAGRDGMLANNKTMELVGERQVAQNGFKGSEYLILQDKFSFGIIRAFVIHGRLYQLGVLAPADVAFRRAQPSARAEDRTEFFNLLATRFLDSFKLLESVDERPSDSVAEVDEVDQMVAQLKSHKQDVVFAACCGSDAGGNSSGILNGKALHLVTPPYPAVARSAHAAGQVSVKVLIDLDGKVAAAQAVAGNPLLRAVSVKAARESKFSPTLLEGKPVMIVGIIIYNFIRQ
jgi:hypothetical protein